MVHNGDFSSIDGHDALITRVAALHVVYMLNKSQIMWFGQLVSQIPSIMISLRDKQSPDTSEMVRCSYWFIITKVIIAAIVDASSECSGEGTGSLESSNGKG